ncbi:signal transduction histidine kinase [Isoptericola variabilis J7]|uniref:sensor histidine kinase n=1 Tax=Isoptericola variabilis TaxID=139208 RepID=UPI0011A46003|nr:sensor histidine kinase [Isoptericola variabilis]TWH28268.1 signal transduction histidine kinase [Isoptericola variabilis J7]
MAVVTTRIVPSAAVAAAAAVLSAAARIPELGHAAGAASVATAPFVLGMVVLAATGALLATLKPGGPMAWLLIGTGLAGVGGRLVLVLAVLAHQEGHGTATPLGWLTNWAWLPMQVLAVVLLLRFPDGTLPSGRWRGVEAAAFVWGAAGVVTTALVPGPLAATQLAPRTNPVGLVALAGPLDVALGVVFTIQPLLLLGGTAALVLRWRQAPSGERARLRHVVLALALLAVATPLAPLSGVGAVLEGLAWLVLPATVAHAVVRRGLWDLDLPRRFDRLRRVREEERARLQRDLHDSLGPLLGSISMRVEAARQLLGTQTPPGEIDRVLASVGESAEAAVVEVRRLVDELGPSALAETDLRTALVELVERSSGPGLEVTLDAPAPLPPLDAAVEIALYRIVGEAVRNVARHARASRCTVSLRPLGTGVSLEVVDDGVGLRGQPPGVGRRAMAERVEALGGRLELSEPATGGVRVRAEIPARHGSPAGVRAVTS